MFVVIVYYRNMVSIVCDRMMWLSKSLNVCLIRIFSRIGMVDFF